MEQGYDNSSAPPTAPKNYSSRFAENPCEKQGGGGGEMKLRTYPGIKVKDRLFYTSSNRISRQYRVSTASKGSKELVRERAYSNCME